MCVDYRPWGLTGAQGAARRFASVPAQHEVDSQFDAQLVGTAKAAAMFSLHGLGYRQDVRRVHDPRLLIDGRGPLSPRQ